MLPHSGCLHVLITEIIFSILTWSYSDGGPVERITLIFNTTTVPGLQLWKDYTVDIKEKIQFDSATSVVEISDHVTWSHGKEYGGIDMCRTVENTFSCKMW